ncbi:MAG TPA: BACON domain-containing protein [Candidatus Brocadiia bacterium]|nr:hypothetical protein [Candidatus Brocadiales bacterium]
MGKGGKLNWRTFSKRFVLFSGICFLLSVSCYLSPVLCYGQWAATYARNGFDQPRSIQQTIDGGYIAAGTSGSTGANTNGGYDIWVVKLDANGAIQWQKAYGGSLSEYAGDIRQTNDGGYIVAGSTYSFGAGKADILVIKLDAMGNIQWQKTYGKSDYDVASSIQQTFDGGYIVAGTTTSFGVVINGIVSEIPDAWVLKLDAIGNIQWQKVYGGTASDTASSIQQTSDGGYIVAGTTFLPTSGANADIWVFKLDASGKIQWQKTFVDKIYMGGLAYEYATSVQQTSDGGFVVAGCSGAFGGGAYSGGYGGDFWVLKLDTNGNLQWQKTYGGPYGEWAYSIQQTSDDGYIVAGRTLSFPIVGDVRKVAFWVLKLDISGIVQWQKTYGRSHYDEAFSIQQTSDGGYIVAGLTYTSGIGWHFWVLKLEPNGTISPSCDFIRDTNILGMDSIAIPVNTSASVRKSRAKTLNAYATVRDINSSPNYLCYAGTIPTTTVPTTTTTIAVPTTTTITTTTTTINTTTTTIPSSSLAKICFTPPAKFSLTRGQTQCAPLQIWNCGSGTLNFSVSENCNWLTLSPTSGTSTGNMISVQACVDTTGMAIGGYQCTVTITTPGASNPTQMCVIELEIQ